MEVEGSVVVEAAVEAVIVVVEEAAAIVEAVVVVPYPDRVTVVVEVEERLDQVLVELVVVLNALSGHPKVLDPLRGLVVQGWPIVVVVELASLGEVEQVNWDGVETRIRTLARSLHGMVEGRAGT